VALIIPCPADHNASFFEWRFMWAQSSILTSPTTTGGVSWHSPKGPWGSGPPQNPGGAGSAMYEARGQLDAAGQKSSGTSVSGLAERRSLASSGCVSLDTCIRTFQRLGVQVALTLAGQRSTKWALLVAVYVRMRDGGKAVRGGYGGVDRCD
jgi:hypothetical protein